MTGYRSEGSALFATDESVGKGNLIFTFYYTKTLSDLFSIDNVRILNRVTETPLEPEIPDKPEILPNLIEVEPFSASNLLFSFDSPVDISDAVFNISTIGDAYTKSYVDTDTKRVVKYLL